MDDLQERSKLVAELDAQLLRVVKQLDKCSEWLDQVRLRLKAAEGTLPATAAGNGKSTDDVLRRVVRPVHVLLVVEKANGGSDVYLDDDPPISLPKSLTKLLLWIAGDPLPNGLPRYKTTDETMRFLLLSSKHTLNQQIYRLRQLLQENDRNHFLVDTNNSNFRFLARDVIVCCGKSPK